MRNNINHIIVAASTCIGMLGASSCQPGMPINNTVTIQTIKDVSYGTHASQKMDVYLPSNRDSVTSPAIILIHGGAWMSGDKSDFNETAQTLQKSLSGYVVFNLNYRLANFSEGNGWPIALNDVDSAISFITNKAKEYRVNPDKLAIVGASAGGHLGLLKAYSLNQGNRIKAVVDLFGPTDLSDLYNHATDPTLPVLLGFFMNGSPSVNPAGYRSASPLFQVSAASPPTIIFHGTADPLVPVYQSDSLYKRLQNAGITSELIKYTGEGHGWAGSKLADTYAKAVAFIRKHVE